MPETSYTISLQKRNEFTVKKLIQLKYNTTSSSYDDLYRDEQIEKYNEIRDVLKSFLSRKMQILVILDAGCGTGLLLEYLYQLLTHVLVKPLIYYIGLDFSIGMLSQAKKKINQSLGRVLVDLILSDIDYLPLRDKVIDTLVSITVIQNLPSMRKTLMELFRVVKENGIFIVSHPKKVYDSIYSDIIHSNIKHMRIFSKQSKDTIWYTTKR